MGEPESTESNTEQAALSAKRKRVREAQSSDPPKKNRSFFAGGENELRVVPHASEESASDEEKEPAKTDGRSERLI